jgi:glycosyltransferase involved in cell wall biosynthesis
VVTAAKPGKVRVVLSRGHHATEWGLQPFAELPNPYEARLLLTQRNAYDLGASSVKRLPVRTLRDRLPRGWVGNFAAMALRDRYLDVGRHLREADIVHSEELSLWFSGDLARHKAEFGYRLVVTVWETIPMLNAFRNPHARRYRRATLEAADLYVAASQRAANALLLEGVPEERIEIAYPGVDVERFAEAAKQEPAGDTPVLISPGRLEWEKGHHDVLRALAAIKQGLVPTLENVARSVRLMIIGSGPEEERLRQHATELGIADAVEIAGVPYERMPALYQRASALVLASLSSSGCALHPGGIPRCFWEEQFGFVLAEALAAGLPMVLSSSGAIPEVAGGEAHYFLPGDWMHLAELLAEGPLSRRPGTREEYPPELIERFSTRAAAARMAAAYDRALGMDQSEPSASSR